MKFRPSSIGKFLGALALAGVVSASMAAPTTIFEDGFEDGGLSWNFVHPSLSIETNQGRNTIYTKSLSYSASDAATATVSTIDQFNFLTGRSYSLRFHVRRDSDDENNIIVGDTPLLDVRLGNSSLALGAPADVTPSDPNDPDNANNPNQNTYIWWRYSLDLGDALSGSKALSFDFSQGQGGFAYLDNVRLVDYGCTNLSTRPDCTPDGPGGNVPEPGSLLLVGAALAGLGLVRRRKTV